MRREYRSDPSTINTKIRSIISILPRFSFANIFDLSYGRTSLEIIYPIICPESRQAEGYSVARIVDGTEMNMIGDKLRTLRTAKGWSQQTVSDKLEMLAIYVCRGSISRIEDKQRTVTDIELYGLSQVFQVPVSYFFPE